MPCWTPVCPTLLLVSWLQADGHIRSLAHPGVCGSASWLLPCFQVAKSLSHSIMPVSCFQLSGLYPVCHWPAFVGSQSVMGSSQSISDAQSPGASHHLPLRQPLNVKSANLYLSAQSLILASPSLVKDQNDKASQPPHQKPRFCPDHPRS